MCVCVYVCVYVFPLIDTCLERKKKKAKKKHGAFPMQFLYKNLTLSVLLTAYDLLLKQTRSPPPPPPKKRNTHLHYTNNVGNVSILVGTPGHVKFKVGEAVMTGKLPVMIGGSGRGEGRGSIWQGLMVRPGLGVGR